MALVVYAPVELLVEFNQMRFGVLIYKRVPSFHIVVIVIVGLVCGAAQLVPQVLVRHSLFELGASKPQALFDILRLGLIVVLIRALGPRYFQVADLVSRYLPLENEVRLSGNGRDQICFRDHRKSPFVGLRRVYRNLIPDNLSLKINETFDSFSVGQSFVWVVEI